jgi:NADPH2:quinone reductase
MKAALYRTTGPAADVLTVEDIERPEPAPGEVLVRVHASGINPTDWKMRAGLTPQPIDGFQIPHQDGAGVIEAVGAGVDAARVGERVWLWFAAFRRRWGTAAQWTVVPADRAVPLTGSFELGASLGVPAMTARHCLGSLDDRTVLIAGGAGAVGHFAINIAKRAGLRVISTVSGPEKGALAKEAGADLVVNYRSGDAAQEIRAFAPDGVDRIVEVALGANLELDLAVAHAGTTIVTYAAEAQNPVLPVRACMSANVTLQFTLLYSLPTSVLDQAAAEVSAALADNALTELPVHRFALDDIVAAHLAAESGVMGKVLVIPD